MQMKRYLESFEATEALAKEIARFLKASFMMGFSGDVGMGKTSLVRALLRDLGVQSSIKSPTFNLVETYETHLGMIHHFDLYRIHSMDDLEYLGFRDYLQGQNICLIEWPEQVPGMNALLDIHIQFQMPHDRDGREILLKANTISGEQMMASLMGKS